MKTRQRVGDCRIPGEPPPRPLGRLRPGLLRRGRPLRPVSEDLAGWRIPFCRSPVPPMRYRGRANSPSTAIRAMMEEMLSAGEPSGNSLGAKIFGGPTCSACSMSAADQYIGARNARAARETLAVSWAFPFSPRMSAATTAARRIRPERPAGSGPHRPSAATRSKCSETPFLRRGIVMKRYLLLGLLLVLLPWPGGGRRTLADLSTVIQLPGGPLRRRGPPDRRHYKISRPTLSSTPASSRSTGTQKGSGRSR